MCKFLNKILIFLVFISMNFLTAQSLNIIGKVLESETNNPLIGATVIVKGSTKGVTTDFDGNFKISADSGQILSVSYIGYEDIEVE